MTQQRILEGFKMQMPKWIEEKDSDEKLRKQMLKVIERANEKVMMAASLCTWMLIHQGNDYY